jgi:signal transduction histidine kinase
MSITKKTLLITFSLMIPLFLAIYFISEFVAYNGFEKLEQKSVEQNLLQAQDAVTAKLHSLERLTEDWANWDDTYYYAQHGNQEFIEQNMDYYTFSTTELNVMMIFDITNKLIFAKAYDFENSREIMVPLELMDSSVQQTLTARTPELITNQGILKTKGFPLLLVAKPILMNDGSGPEAGTLVLGMTMDAIMVQSFSDTTHLSLSIYNIDDSNLPPDFVSAKQSISNASMSYVKPVDKNSIDGYRILSDIFGNPALIMKVDLPRDIYIQGRSTVTLMHALLLLISGVFFVLFILILRRMVLSRIITLDGMVLDISESRNNSKRVAIPGNDELARLAVNINKMLTSLEKADQEITKLYQQEKAHSEELEEEGKARSQFINVLAHELRTPLTPILLSVEMVRDILSTDKNTIQYKMINNALCSADTLRSRLEELLDIARFARGVFKLKNQIIEPNEYLRTIIERYKPALDQKHQDIKLDIAPGLPQINADPSRLEQVLLNLLSNASKYSPEHSEIRLKAHQLDCYLQIEIKDQGIGVPPEEQSNLFIPYHRAEQDRHSYPGIGLGLAVCSQIVQAHGGRIWVESDRGNGSTFIFTLPIKPETVDLVINKEETITFKKMIIPNKTG